MSDAGLRGTLATAVPPSDNESPSDGLDEVLVLILRQRTALLTGDLAGIENANACLLAWMRNHEAGESRLDPAHISSLRAALDQNSSLARRSALQAGRALDVLLPSPADHGGGLYTSQGISGRNTARRRTVRSCA